jgi:DGQHR domain-containing protein
MSSQKSLDVPALRLQEAPLIYVTALPGRWLLDHATPSWRIANPEKGFQRVVKEGRAIEIATAVLAQKRTFPNSLVLATDRATFPTNGDASTIHLPHKAKFLVVDGQHRLWAQQYSADYEATYSCVMHMGLSEVQMARLFLEINDTQKRVPASLRWDLVRLVRPEDDEFGIRAADLVFQLATDDRSPLYQRIDLTGEKGPITLKQASVAPEIKSVVTTASGKGGLRALDFDAQYDVLCRYSNAIRSCDPDAWADATSPLYGARVFRVLIRLLPSIISDLEKPAQKVTVQEYYGYLSRIGVASLAPDEIRAAQGSAGMKEILSIVSKQVFGK